MVLGHISGLEGDIFHAVVSTIEKHVQVKFEKK